MKRREWDESEKRREREKWRKWENFFECPSDDRLTHHTQVFSVLTNVIPFFSFSSLLSLLFFLLLSFFSFFVFSYFFLFHLKKKLILIDWSWNRYFWILHSHQRLTSKLLLILLLVCFCQIRRRSETVMVSDRQIENCRKKENRREKQVEW